MPARRAKNIRDFRGLRAHLREEVSHFEIKTTHSGSGTHVPFPESYAFRNRPQCPGSPGIRNRRRAVVATGAQQLAHPLHLITLCMGDGQSQKQRARIVALLEK